MREFLANSTDLQRIIQKSYLGENKSNEEIIIIIATNITTDINYIRQDGDIKVGIHSITTIKYLFYITVIPIISVTVNKIIEYFTLINTGAKLNIIIINVTNKAGLAIRTRIKIKITSYSEYTSRFLGIIENILISIDLISYRVNIFVIRSAPQSLIFLTGLQTR